MKLSPDLDSVTEYIRDKRRLMKVETEQVNKMSDKVQQQPILRWFHDTDWPFVYLYSMYIHIKFVRHQILYTLVH